MLIKGDARNTRPPIVKAFEDQILYLMTDADDAFKGRANPDRNVTTIIIKTYFGFKNGICNNII